MTSLTLKAIKALVNATLSNEQVRAFGDLRKTATWQAALDSITTTTDNDNDGCVNTTDPWNCNPDMCPHFHTCNILELDSDATTDNDIDTVEMPFICPSHTDADEWGCNPDSCEHRSLCAALAVDMTNVDVQYMTELLTIPDADDNDDTTTTTALLTTPHTNNVSDIVLTPVDEFINPAMVLTMMITGLLLVLSFIGNEIIVPVYEYTKKTTPHATRWLAEVRSLMAVNTTSLR